MGDEPTAEPWGTGAFEVLAEGDGTGDSLMYERGLDVEGLP